MLTEHTHPKRNYTAFTLACYCTIFTGAGHLSLELITRLTQDQAAYDAFVANMPIVNLMGRVVSFNQLTTGFSYAMGLLLISLGLSYLQNKQRTQRFKLVAVVTLATMLVLAIQYFFIIPIALLTLATLLFFLALFEKNKHQEVSQ